jgi:hypothetical protein
MAGTGSPNASGSAGGAAGAGANGSARAAPGAGGRRVRAERELVERAGVVGLAGGGAGHGLGAPG